MNRMAVILLGLFVLLGPTPLIVGAAWTWLEWTEYRKAVDREGTQIAEGWLPARVVILSCTPIHRDPRSGDWTYRGEGEWKDRNGQTHRRTLVGGSCSRGTTYELRYNPENPEENAYVIGWFKPVPLVLFALGLGFTVIGVKEWRKARRANPAPSG